jgi:hypothetical protein
MLNNTHYCILFCIIIVILYYNNIKESFDNAVRNTRQCNDIDGHCYKVSTKYATESIVDASNMLARVNARIIEFLRYLRAKYLWADSPNMSAGAHSTTGETPPTDRFLHSVAYAYKKKVALRLLEMYNPDNLIENVPAGIVNTSYVEDKGKIFALCLRERMSGQNLIENAQTLFFVTLHELSHIANESFGHDRDFWFDFKVLLHEAHAAKIYQPIDYAVHPVYYCGLQITYNPYYDDELTA